MMKLLSSLVPSRGVSVRDHAVPRKLIAAGGVTVLAVSGAVTAVPAAAAAPANSIADSYTVSTLPQENNGSSEKVSVGLDNYDYKVGYLKFPAGAAGSTNLMDLQLSISGGDPGEIEIHQVSPNWTENGIRAESAPDLGPTLGRGNVNGDAESLTLRVKDVKAIDGEIALALTRSGDGISRVISKEGPSGLVPQLVTVDGSTPPPAKGSPNCSVTAKLVPSCGAWFGASANPLSGESWDTALENFEETAARPMDIVHYYKRGQNSMFPNNVELDRQNEAGRNRILFYNWKPEGLTWRQVANGAADEYLRDLAVHMKANADKPFFLSLNAEMEDEVRQYAGSGQTVQDYRDFFRHTVNMLRNNGAENVVTVMNYTGIQKWGEMPWFDDLYPGGDVVDWIAQDPYAFGAPPLWLTDFEGMVNRTNGGSWRGFYNWAATNYPDKPQMLGEWGVDEDPVYPSYKTNFFKSAADQLAQYPKIKALVYWDSSGMDTSGNELSVGDTRVDSKRSTLLAFRQYVDEDILNAPRRAYLD